jgi:hypothetical protein
LRLNRLTYVHDGDPGKLGELIAELRGNLRFDEGSGLFELGSAGLRSGPPAGSTLGETNVRISTLVFSALPPELQDAIGAENLPCILGHLDEFSEVLVPQRSLARWSGGLSDLRGKIRYGLARVGWTL